MTIGTGSQVMRPGGQVPSLATVAAVKGSTAFLEYEEGGSGYWPIDELEEVNSPSDALWVEFVVTLMSNSLVTELVVAVARQAPMLDRMLTVGLGQAAKGDPATFARAWLIALQSGFVTAELISQVAALATAHNLPSEFIAGLSGGQS